MLTPATPYFSTSCSTVLLPFLTSSISGRVEAQYHGQDRVHDHEPLTQRLTQPHCDTQHALTHLAFLGGVEIACRSLASNRRERSLRVRLMDELLLT